MYEPLAVAAEPATAQAPERAPHFSALRLKVAVAAAIPAVGILVSSAHAWAQGCSCG